MLKNFKFNVQVKSNLHIRILKIKFKIKMNMKIDRVEKILNWKNINKDSNNFLKMNKLKLRKYNSSQIYMGRSQAISKKDMGLK